MTDKLFRIRSFRRIRYCNDGCSRYINMDNDMFNINSSRIDLIRLFLIREGIKGDVMHMDDNALRKYSIWLYDTITRLQIVTWSSLSTEEMLSIVKLNMSYAY